MLTIHKIFGIAQDNSVPPCVIDLQFPVRLGVLGIRVG